MKILSFISTVILLLAYSGTCQSSQTIVPKESQITDVEAQFALAKILSRHKETQEAALQLYEALLNGQEQPADLIVYPKIKTYFNLEKDSAEAPKTIVPKNSWITRFDAIWTVAKIFSRQEKNQERALKLYAGLLQEKPENMDLVIDMGRLYITLKRFEEGLNLFYQALSKHPCDIKLLVATAQAEVASGHAKDARALFLKALDLSHCQEALLIDYADAMMMWGDFFKAEEIYREALKKNCSLEFSVKLAGSLEAQQRYEEAEGIYRKLLFRWPDDPKILESLTRLKVREKNFDQALELVESLLQLEPTIPKTLQLKAEILFQKLLYCESIAIYNEFKEDRKYGVRAYVGMGRAYQKMGFDDEAQASFESAYAMDPKDIEARYYVAEGNVCEDFLESIIGQNTSSQDLNELANVYLQNGKPESALIIYTAILESDPEYFPGLIGKAEVLSVLFSYNCALEIYLDLLESFPENAKLLMAIARVYSWSKNYEVGIQYYDRIIQLNSKNPVPYREKARTALWDKKFCLAMATYDEVLAWPVEDLDDYLIHESIYLEKRAKVLNWNKRYICSIEAYKELLAFNPGNEEALFDLAQVYCTLGLCDYSRCVYEHILNLAPNHSIVKKAVDRNERNNNFALQGNFAYWREVGSGSFSASQIARYRMDQVFEVPLSCRSHLRFSQQEYVENPFLNYKFYPAEGQTIEADYLFSEQANVFVSATYKNYFGKFRSTITSRNRLLWTVNDCLQVLVSINKEDEIYNFFSLEQSIQSTVGLITLSSKLTRYWNAAGTYQYYRYNDHNSQVHVNLLTEYQITEDPNVWKVILQGDYRNAAHQTIFDIVGTELVDMTHPYWTPDKYYSASLTLQWHHDYRQFEFCEAPQRYIDIKITGLTDNAENPSVSALLEWKHEFDCHWGFELKGFIQRGPLWRAEGSWATLSYRF